MNTTVEMNNVAKLNCSPDSMINISAYYFLDLNDLPALRTTIKSFCVEHDLKGTILISLEGINMFVSGSRKNIEAYKTFITQLLPLENIEFKESPSSHQPFTRMLVRIKKEIISMGVPEIRPSQFKAPYMTAKDLKKWLDEGRPVTLIDTRNTYEIKLGKFKNALELDINSFRAFPDEIEKMKSKANVLDDLNNPIVTYCTGGIRCEKAASFMINKGFKEVYQLEGGILKYFEECGQAHYEGECFVFDKRVAVNAELNETNTVQCFACRMPVTVEEQQSEKYKIAEYCPACYEWNKGK